MGIEAGSAALSGIGGESGESDQSDLVAVGIAKLSREAVAIGARKVQIDQNGIQLSSPRFGQRLDRVARLADPVPLRGEQESEHSPEVVAVIDEENLTCGPRSLLIVADAR